MKTMHMNDPYGKFGLAFLSGGYLLHIMNTIIARADIAYWAGLTCTCIGGVYYLLKIYFDFIKKAKK
jgi:hypothetical protein